MPTDAELCDKQINTILKLYKMERPLPKHIRDDITRVLENIGWSCWFADWLNHRIYCWVLEINATSSTPNLAPFIHFEDIESDSESDSESDREDIESKQTYDEYCVELGIDRCYKTRNTETVKTKPVEDLGELIRGQSILMIWGCETTINGYFIKKSSKNIWINVFAKDERLQKPPEVVKYELHYLRNIYID